jgi:hypothetical protein
MSDVHAWKPNGVARAPIRKPSGFAGREGVLADTPALQPSYIRKAGARTRHVTARLSEQEYEAVLKYAEEHGTTPSELVRVLIDGELSDQAAMSERRAMAELPLVVARLAEEVERLGAQMKCLRQTMKESLEEGLTAERVDEIWPEAEE